MAMKVSSTCYLALSLCLLLNVSLSILTPVAAKKVRITDELGDVEDNEEDEAWKEWGKPKSKPMPFDPPKDPPTDPAELEKYQAEMMKQQTGPSMGFVKLRLGVQRKAEEATHIARKWTDLLKTAAIQAKIMAVDRATIMFILERGQDTMEVKDFVLSQDEAYEFKLGNTAYRRPGDPPLEVVVEKLEADKKKFEKGKEIAEAELEKASMKEELR